MSPTENGPAHRDPARLTTLVSGTSGLIGSALSANLTADGQRVLRLVRHAAASPDEVAWDPQRGILEPDALGPIDALIHLAGENIAAGRWTRRRMDAIRRSRVDGTRALLSSLARCGQPEATVLCASAIGIYGDRADEWLSEQSPPGHGFLADVCREWEDAVRTHAPTGVRCVNLRFGVVLAAAGGMLAKLRPVFRWGLGGRVGSGRQFMSWISLADALGAVRHALGDERVAGPVNIVAPEPVTNSEFVRVFAHVLHRPALFPVPAVVLRLALGRLADDALLASARARPAVLLQSGYEFQHPDLIGALRAELGQADP